MSSPAVPRTVVIGAGPAGLTAAYQLTAHGAPVRVFEADDVVGGISRTVERDGWRFDIGGHRFFTKVAAVEALWREILPAEDFLLRPRMSRIYYQGKLYDYPLRALNALRNLGPAQAALAIGSYAWARARPPKDQADNYEAWLVARFGWRLYRTFFKTYTEKLWGIPVSEMPADWAAQRVKNLSLSSAIANAVLPRRNQKEITSLIEEFHYPKLGPGMMWEEAARKVEKLGGGVTLNAAVTAVHRADGRAVAITVTTSAGEVERVPADHVISSTPLSTLILSMDPPAPARVVEAARDLRYRDYLTVALVVPAEFSFPDNWIYIHDPGVRVGRIQNYGSWSPYLVQEGRTCLGLEFFVFEGDDMWTKPDDELIALATRELESLRLVRPGAVERGYVVRVPKAYPTYDQYYRRNVEIMREWLEENVPNVHPVGRNGMHRYNNADHSMLTAMLTVENILDGTAHDVWTVNVEEEYHEEKRPAAGSPTRPAKERITGTGRDAPVIPRRTSPPH
ncbi:NAD(P)/FAD-dependent oxidoreductase [Frankia sp. CNm7]|uniref:NAD(P)/FAD-dependent oxidoreductase n=1 Tax=Frankia nepalensis TaxID=1836974 RepID=A0A937UR19_9ACTN|nr:NAD(P)/FAD-dependent oxidoreductase [Frankia nepalensis]MBL7499230.1 NAD(P)/FAD-dependent oxidoreductase [Frankia nepalensis]MBL7512124.1 NAD(P)/FAD-dependent oxidoreductase [Frankia nepalensis]MBL7521027.1 NAD(P)/FAD-dependent oxidoreductase [Frankia nepalensis]MBL7627301.1 NAD(P)/FAD-dependent oxidoreductase [Frankia nepalensis]